VRCSSQWVDIDTGGLAAPVGTPAKVTATVTCIADLSDLSMPGLPGSRTITATMSSPIDTYRERWLMREACCEAAPIGTGNAAR
jgi:hypothetical protein